MIRKNILLALLVFALLGMGLFAHRMWRLVLIHSDRGAELAKGNWVFSENLHFFCLYRNNVNIYSKNLPAQTLILGDVQLNVVPLFLSPGQQSTSADILIFTNDIMLLRFACFLSITGRKHDLAEAILHLLAKNVSWVGESDPYFPFIISACKALLNEDDTYQELVNIEANSYAIRMKHYQAHFGNEQPTWLQSNR